MEQRTTFGVAFYIRRTRLNKHGEAAIQLRITINRMQADTTAKKTIAPALWHAGRGKAIEKSSCQRNKYVSRCRPSPNHSHSP